MGEFFDNIKIIINTLGYKVLEPLLQIDDNGSSDGEMLYLSTGNASAVGQVTSEGFVVLKGAVLSEKLAKKSLNPEIRKLRFKLSEEGQVDNLVTKEDILFNSSSAAAAFVLGYNTSGPEKWKTKEGKTLKEIEQNVTEN